MPVWNMPLCLKYRCPLVPFRTCRNPSSRPSGFGGVAFWKGAAVETVTADSAVVHGPVEKGNSVFGAGLREYVAHVVINRSLADGQLVGDFLIGEPISDQLDDFDLAS